MKIFRSDDAAPRPVQNWLMLMLIAVLVLLLLMGWSFALYERVVNGGVLGTQPSLQTSELDAVTLKTMEEVLKARAIAEQKYVSGEIHFVDPAK